MQVAKFPDYIFVELINILEERKIDYIVLRNYQFLPHTNSSKDVDFLISPSQNSSIKTVISELKRKVHLSIIKVTTLDYLYSYVLTDCQHDDIYSIKLDFFIGLTWRGISFVDVNQILKSKIKYNGFYVPLKGHEALIMVNYYLLYARKVPSKYHENIFRNFSFDKSSFYNLGHTSIGEKLTDNIAKAIDNMAFDSLTLIRRKLIKMFFLKSVRSPLFCIYLLKHIYSELKFRIKKGPFIVFLGPDGAGKSTILEHVMNFYQDLGMNIQSEPGHFMPSEIPAPHRLSISPNELKTQDYTQPYSSPPAGRLSSLIRIVYYFIAFLFGYPIYIRKHQIHDYLVFYDRYYIDMLVDGTRYRIGYGQKLVKFLFSWLKKPDLIICIYALPDNILKRKKELTREKIVELLANYKIMAIEDNQFIMINNDVTIVESVSCSIRTINKFLTSRIKI